MPEPTLTNARHDPLLTNLLIELTNDRSAYVHGQMFPVVPVRLPAGTYKAVKPGELFKDRVKERPMGEAPESVGFEFEDKTYSVKEEGLMTTIDDRERANFNMGGSALERIKVTQIIEEMLIHLDRKWNALFFATASWTTQLDGTALANGRWDASGSTPIADIRSQVRVMQKLRGKKANRLLLGQKVFDTLLDHADVLDRFKGGATPQNIANTQMDILRQIFFPEDPTARVVVASAIQNTADSGLTESMDFIMNEKNYLLCYAANSPAIGIATAGATFSWTNLMANATPGPGQAPGVLRGRDDKASSDWFQVRMGTDFAVVDAGLGTYMTEAVS